MAENLGLVKRLMEIPRGDKNPALGMECRRYMFGQEQFSTHEIYEILFSTMREYKGLGLAANQIGLPFRVCVIDYSRPLIFFNPIIVEESKETMSAQEGCLSYPDLHLTIKRPLAIKVRYAKADGTYITEVFQGMEARILHHEIRHLDGYTYIQDASIIQKEKAKKFLKGLDRI